MVRQGRSSRKVPVYPKRSWADLAVWEDKVLPYELFHRVYTMIGVNADWDEAERGLHLPVECQELLDKELGVGEAE